MHVLWCAWSICDQWESPYSILKRLFKPTCLLFKAFNTGIIHYIVTLNTRRPPIIISFGRYKNYQLNLAVWFDLPSLAVQFDQLSGLICSLVLSGLICSPLLSGLICSPLQSGLICSPLQSSLICCLVWSDQLSLAILFFCYAIKKTVYQCRSQSCFFFMLPCVYGWLR